MPLAFAPFFQFQFQPQAHAHAQKAAAFSFTCRPLSSRKLFITEPSSSSSWCSEDTITSSFSASAFYAPFFCAFSCFAFSQRFRRRTEPTTLPSTSESSESAPRFDPLASTGARAFSFALAYPESPNTCLDESVTPPLEFALSPCPCLRRSLSSCFISSPVCWFHATRCTAAFVLSPVPLAKSDEFSLASRLHTCN